MVVFCGIRAIGRTHTHHGHLGMVRSFVSDCGIMRLECVGECGTCKAVLDTLRECDISLEGQVCPIRLNDSLYNSFTIDTSYRSM
jgi:hypothetical protein